MVRKLLAALAVAAALLVAGVLLLRSGDGAPPAPGPGLAPDPGRDAADRRGAPGPSAPTVARTSPRQLPAATIELRINGESDRSVGVDVPLFVRLTVQLRTADADIPDALPSHGPALIADDRALTPDWRALPPVTSADGTTITLTWVLDAAPAPATYAIEAPAQHDALGARYGDDAVTMSPARLVVRAEPEVPAVAAHYRRRVAALEDPASWLQLIRAAVAAAPDDPRLRLELADALLATGDPGAALGELRALAGRLDPGTPLPHRLAQRLEAAQHELASDGPGG